MPKRKRVLTALEKICIKKFFFDEFKNISQFGGKKIKQLGLEASLEACFALFEDGELKLKAFNKDEFFVFLYHKKPRKWELIYDNKKILI